MNGRKKTLTRRRRKRTLTRRKKRPARSPLLQRATMGRKTTANSLPKGGRDLRRMTLTMRKVLMRRLTRKTS